MEEVLQKIIFEELSINAVSVAVGLIFVFLFMRGVFAMVYTLVDSGSGCESGFGPVSKYPMEDGYGVVLVSSGYSPDFVRCLIGRILFDFFEACGGHRHWDIGALCLAEVLRDFFGFEVLGCGSVTDGEGMVVDLRQLFDRFWNQERHLVQSMGVFDRPGLQERLAGVCRSVKQGLSWRRTGRP